MNNQPTISLGAKVIIYVFSAFFDIFTIVITAFFFVFGIATTAIGIGLAMPAVAVVLNKFIIMIALMIFVLIYQVVGVGIGSKLQRLILKKSYKKFLWPWLIKFLPFLGWLPMITLSNWLLIRIVERHDRKQAQKTEAELLEENGGYA